LHTVFFSGTLDAAVFGLNDQLSICHLVTSRRAVESNSDNSSTLPFIHYHREPIFRFLCESKYITLIKRRVQCQQARPPPSERQDSFAFSRPQWHSDRFRSYQDPSSTLAATAADQVALRSWQLVLMVASQVAPLGAMPNSSFGRATSSLLFVVRVALAGLPRIVPLLTLVIIALALLLLQYLPACLSVRRRWICGVSLSAAPVVPLLSLAPSTNIHSVSQSVAPGHRARPNRERIPMPPCPPTHPVILCVYLRH